MWSVWLEQWDPREEGGGEGTGDWNWFFQSLWCSCYFIVHLPPSTGHPQIIPSSPSNFGSQLTVYFSSLFFANSSICFQLLCRQSIHWCSNITSSLLASGGPLSLVQSATLNLAQIIFWKVFYQIIFYFAIYTLPASPQLELYFGILEISKILLLPFSPILSQFICLSEVSFLASQARPKLDHLSCSLISILKLLPLFFLPFKIPILY
jgi:hypothetical protein